MTVKAVIGCSLPAIVGLAISLPPVWGAIGFCLAAGFFSVRYRYRKTQARERQRLRACLAADLHDDVGANLSQIAVLTEVLRRQTEHAHPQIASALAALAQLSGETIDAMSDIVWATNPKHDSLANLVSRMRRFASEILPAAQIEFTFVAPLPETVVHLDGELRRQLFLVFKESLNNIVCHARCTQAAIELCYEDEQLLLQIRDNGRGFVLHCPDEGNGLPNLQRRARTIGAALTLNSFPGGTTIRLRVPPRQPARMPKWQSVRRWLCPGRRWFRLAWHWSRTYLNRGVTVIANRLTLPVPFVKTNVRAQPQPQRKAL